jgi:multidrug resistance efflux pump
MISALFTVVIFVIIFWFIFFKKKWITYTFAWGFGFVLVLAHVFFIFMIGLRFVTPYTTEARVIQHTIQIIPRLPHPSLVTAVLVEPDVPVKKGQPLFEFDKTTYQYNVDQLEAELAQAMQDVKEYKAQVEIATQKLAKARAELEYAEYQKDLATGLAETGAGPEEDAQREETKFLVIEASIKEAEAELEKAKLRYNATINGEHTNVAVVKAKLAEAKYCLNNTTIYAPEDGRIINLQVRPGMVSGIVRFGAIASFICDEGPYLLANYFQENLKYVKVGQPVEVALNLYPGQIFPGKVEAIWNASGAGQLLPSGELPDFEPVPPEKPQNQFAVKIVFDAEDQSMFPIGAEGSCAIYTNGMKGSWAALRRIGIRTYSWLNWLYPIPF